MFNTLCYFHCRESGLRPIPIPIPIQTIPIPIIHY